MPIVITKTHKKHLQVQLNYNIVFNFKCFINFSDVLIVYLLIIYNMNFTLQIYFEVIFVYWDRKLH